MSTTLTDLDEKGFVFKGADKRFWLCRMWGDTPWFFYQHPDGQWVSYKQVTQQDVWDVKKQQVPDEVAEECNRKAKMI